MVYKKTKQVNIFVGNINYFYYSQINFYFLIFERILSFSINILKYFFRRLIKLYTGNLFRVKTTLKKYKRKVKNKKYIFLRCVYNKVTNFFEVNNETHFFCNTYKLILLMADFSVVFFRLLGNMQDYFCRKLFSFASCSIFSAKQNKSRMFYNVD